MPKKKKPKISTLDKKLWKLFSEYIRKRDCLQSTKTTEAGECITCKKIIPYKKLQAGHYIPRQIRNVRYNEQNINAQCYACNMFYGGMIAEYGAQLDIKYGEGTADMLLEYQRQYRAGEYEKHGIDWYEMKIEDMKDRIKQLETLYEPTLEELPF